MEYVREEVKDMLVKKSITELSYKSHCVNPLTVSIREMAEGAKKKRLCLDLSRWVNKHIKKESTKLVRLEKSCEILIKGDVQAAYDLSVAYHHVKIHDDYKKYLCFMVPDEQGVDRYYQFQVMPFGLSSATQCLARVTKPICAHLASKGIRHSLYIDDGKVNATKQNMKEHLNYILHVLKWAGFVIAKKKTDTVETASTKKNYLGFEIDSNNMIILAGPNKFQAIRRVLDSIDNEEGVVKPKTLAKFVGKAISLQPALGTVVQLLTRIAQIELAIFVDNNG